MTKQILLLNNLSSPRKVSTQELANFFNVIPPFEINDEIKYYIGDEYSKYLIESYAKNLKYEDVFNDSNRYNNYSTEFDFFAQENNFYANSYYQKLDNDYLQDLRIFIGKKKQSTSLHFDWNPGPIVLYNYFGKKKVNFINPVSSIKLKGFGNFSLVNDQQFDDEIIIDTNEAVIIPTYWWHKVDYLTNSKSYSFRLKADSRNEIFKLLYPSWKVLQFISEGFDKLELLQKVASVPLDYKAETYFEEIENYLNEKLNNFSTEHPYYKKYCLDYLRYYKIRD